MKNKRLLDENKKYREALEFIASWYAKYHPPIVEIIVTAKEALDNNENEHDMLAENEILYQMILNSHKLIKTDNCQHKSEPLRARGMSQCPDCGAFFAASDGSDGLGVLNICVKCEREAK
jgi:hypothetical protein